jgi:hypothetical protein
MLSVPSTTTGVGVALGGGGVKVNEAVDVIVSEAVMLGVTVGAGPVQAAAIPARSINRNIRFFIELNSSTKEIGFWDALGFFGAVTYQRRNINVANKFIHDGDSPL